MVNRGWPAVDGIRPYANPSAIHPGGTEAKAILQHARAQVAVLLGAAADEVAFTSGGSEANKLALKGVFFAFQARGNHIVATAVEHPDVLEPLRFLERLGARATVVPVVPVDGTGRVDPDDVRRAMTPRTILVSVMHANNEVGTLQPVAEIAAIARERCVLVHTDAAQSVGKIQTRVDDMGVDLLSIAGHKAYAPKGVGALYMRRGVTLEPLIHGAGHESGRRAGTESVLLAAALGEACEIAMDLERLPNTLSVSFVGRVGTDVLTSLEGVAASTGSACHVGSVELSPVLGAMGVRPEVGMGAVRFSLGRQTTEAEIDHVLEAAQGLMAVDRP